MLSSALRGDVGDSSFEHFQQGLLDALAGDVAGNRNILRRFSDFVDFVHIDYAPLCRFYIEVCILQEAQQEVFDVFADIPGLCNSGGVAYCEGHFKEICKGTGEECLANFLEVDRKSKRLNS